ncbi:expressed protein [Phakopsora pachyrhizi]|uniref:Expressed protein n=1 Tax=Phakopsora pachyrhizi TaxID=170000 RepID=A0AAV0AQ64_PHAPC|nr:expressed protein [Phakopsora pachyrhizi]
MANAAFATETANSPAPVLETPSGNDYSNHATFGPSFDPRAPNQSSAPRPSSSRVPDNSQPHNETRRSPRDSTLLSPTKPPSTSSNRPNMSNPNSSRTRRHLGEYTLGKTLGAGSMGKVKLAVSTITGEKIAIKIIPRHTSLIAVQQQVDKNKENDRATESSNHKDPSFIEKAKAKDISKEVRTIREASIDLLLHHPYICGLKSMLVYPNHYYMLFEYVNGGQMLDYIISHGRLRERAARRFARQMGSALEYCHANSIVHRDLKIENILISKTGNIKIIDFGLSNLFSPNSNLQTFCGSLYFAAPELLNAKVYIGPEVDVWSFGIVLFVLVCGKVPFDDQSMPALHAKIKRGQVEYPSWLSSECKHLLSRMLVTNPANRATLHEVLNHAWMVKGYEGAPDPHIPPREPLRLNQIDSEIVKSMTGFEFGTIEKIEADLKAVLSSEIYLTVLKFYDDRRATGNGGSVEPIYRNAQNGSGSSMPGLTAGIKKDQQRGDRDLPKSTGKASKRFSGFGFYSKRMAGGLAAVFNTVGGSKNEERGSTPDPANQANAGFETVLLNGQTLDSMDPTRGFHPLISVYFLVREKIEREKIYGPGVFASSTVSLTGPPPPPAPPSAYKSSLSPAGLDYNKTTYESHLNGRSPAKNRTKDPGSQFSHHPQRDQASLLLDLHQGDLNSQRPRSRFLPPRPSTATERMVSTPSASLPNSPVKSFNASKNSNSAQNDEAISARRSVHIIPSSQSPGISQQMDEAYLPPKSHRSGLGLGCNGAGNAGRGDRVVSMIETGQQPPSLASPESERSPSFAKRFGSFLGRPTSVAEPDYKRHRPRSSIGGSAHKIGNKTPLSPLPQVAESTTSGSVEPISPGELQQQQQQQGSLGGSPEQGEEGGQAHERVPMSAPVKGSRRPRVTSLQDSNQRPKATTGNICTPAESEEDEDDETQGLEEEESQMIDIQNEESDRPLPSGSRQVEFFGAVFGCNYDNQRTQGFKRRSGNSIRSDRRSTSRDQRRTRVCSCTFNRFVKC